MMTYKMNQVIICPYLIRDGKFFGGVVDKNIKDIAKIKRGNSFVSISPVEVDSPQSILYGKYFWGGVLINHFGHILTESIHRLYAYDDDLYDGLLFSSAWFNESGIKNTTIPSFLVQICDLFGIPFNKIMVIKEPVVVEQLNFAEAGANLNDKAKEWYFAKLYYEHKRDMENLVRSLSKNYLILRLPQLFGEIDPKKNTLIDFICNKVINGELININSNAKRYVLDVKDCVIITEKLLEYDRNNLTMNIANDYCYTILEIVFTIEKLLNKKAIINIDNSNFDNYKLDLSELHNLIASEGTSLARSDYLVEKLKMYISRI